VPQSASTLELAPHASLTIPTPWWLWPNLLSLDAPLVALLWQSLAAKDAGLTLSLSSRIALPLTVWAIYLADRLFDSIRPAEFTLATRHQFYRAHRIAALILLACVSGLLAVSLRNLPPAVLHNGLAVGTLVAAYLLTVHALPAALRYLPKELAVALIFSAGTTLSVWTRMAHPASILFPALLFALLCWLNCSAIEAWETHQPNTLAAHLTPVSLITCAAALLFAPWNACHFLLIAIAVCSLAYCWLNRIRPGLDMDALRVLADLPLLAPLLLLGLR
jgi:hypothetical protein